LICGEETRFLGFLGVVCGGLETGFLWFILKITVICQEETRFLGFLGVVCGEEETGFLWFILKITVICQEETRFLGFLGVVCGGLETGFLWFILKITVICGEETRFLGGLRGLRNRVSFLTAKDNCDMPRRNPVSRLAARTQKPGFYVSPTFAPGHSLRFGQNRVH
jgi:hypothetical protein